MNNTITINNQKELTKFSADKFLFLPGKKGEEVFPMKFSQDANGAWELEKTPQSRLAEYLELRKQPFFSQDSEEWSEQDYRDNERYDEIQEQLKTESATLAKGDEVYFVETIKIKCKKTKNNPFGFEIYYALRKGKVYSPAKHVKKSALAGVSVKDAGDYVREFDEIKVDDGYYVHTISLDEIESVQSNTVNNVKSPKVQKSTKKVANTDFGLLSKGEQDSLVQGILSKDSSLKAAAIKKKLSESGYLNLTYDDVYYSLQRVK